jgi:hypothetical protein
MPVMEVSMSETKDFMGRFNRILKGQKLDPLDQEDFYLVREWVNYAWPRDRAVMRKHEALDRLDRCAFFLHGEIIGGTLFSMSMEYVFRLWTVTRASHATGIEVDFLMNHFTSVENGINLFYAFGSLDPRDWETC